jgi:hypothetical protein
MIDGMLLALAALALAGRVIYFVRFWKAPYSFGPDRFFGLPLPAATDSSQRLLPGRAGAL